MSFTPKKIRALLKKSRKGIYNSLENESVLTLVQEFGYTTERLTELKTLHQTVESSILQRDNKQGMKVALNMRIVNAIDNIYSRSRLYVKYLRRDLKNVPDKITEYLLDAPVARTTGERLTYAASFYKRCMEFEGLAALVAAYGLTAEKSTGFLDEIAQIEKDDDYKAILKGETETSTVARNQLAEQLSDEWVKYKDTLMFVLKEDPQQLEAFGILVYSEGYKPKKNEDEEDGENEDENDDGNDDGNDSQDNDGNGEDTEPLT